MITELTYQEKLVVQNNRALFRYLLGLCTNHGYTPRSWLYESIDPDVVLERWLSILRGLGTGTLEEREVYQFDISQLEKWGPQGGHEPMDELYPRVIAPSFKEHSPASAFGTREWEFAIDKVARNFKQLGLIAIRPASYNRVLDDMRARDTLESNSGWPDFQRRNLPEVKQAALRAASTGQWENYPAIALFRRYNAKTRPVWMFPESTNIVEGSFTQPLQSRLINSGDTFFAPWKGFDAVRRLVTRHYDAGHRLYATDFSATDEHFRYRTSEQVLRLFTRGIIHQGSMPLLLKTVENLHYIPLVISPTQKVVGWHGLASGSNWTNLIETIFDYVFGEYVRETSECEYEPVFAIGDDMLWCSLYPYSFEDFPKIMEHNGKLVGQDLNPDKVSAKENQVKTLQRLFIRDYRRPDGLLRGVYSTVRALKSSIYPERFHKPKNWSSDMFCARQFMILENCVDHPLFEEFVKFVVQGQKDLVPFAKKSDRSLERILRETKLLPGLNPTYNQERRDMALSSFDSIRIARTL